LIRALGAARPLGVDRFREAIDRDRELLKMVTPSESDADPRLSFPKLVHGSPDGIGGTGGAMRLQHADEDDSNEEHSGPEQQERPGGDILAGLRRVGDRPGSGPDGISTLRQEGEVEQHEQDDGHGADEDARAQLVTRVDDDPAAAKSTETGKRLQARSAAPVVARLAHRGPPAENIEAPRARGQDAVS